jgi:hypothetical protein
MFVDPGKHEVAAMCADVWTAAMQAFDAQLIQKYHPDEKEASAFKEAISQELHNPDYQLCGYGFGPVVGHRLIIRHLVIGRKPPGSA